VGVVSLVRDAAIAMGLRRPPRVLMVRDRVSPMVWCGLRTCLVLPVGLWDELDEVGRPLGRSRAQRCDDLLAWCRRGGRHRRRTGAAARLLAAEAADVERVAVHLLRSPPRNDPWVVERLQTAAALASARASPATAAGYLARALEEPAGEDSLVPLLVALAGASVMAPNSSSAIVYPQPR